MVKSDGPNDLVFQSVKDGKPMRDNNILTRFIKPAARELGIGFVNSKEDGSGRGGKTRRRYPGEDENTAPSGW